MKALALACYLAGVLSGVVMTIVAAAWSEYRRLHGARRPLSVSRIPMCRVAGCEAPANTQSEGTICDTHWQLLRTGTKVRMQHDA